MQMCHSLKCKQIDMSTVDVDFSKQRGKPNSREFRSIRRKVYLALGLKSFVDRRQHICKDKESNLGSAAGYQGLNYLELKTLLTCVNIRLKGQRYFLGK